MNELKFTKRDTKLSTESIRSQGLVPAICYGAGFENIAVSVDDIAFRKLYRKIGTSGLIDMAGDIRGEQCLVQDMQVHVVSGDLLHIDFKMVAKGETTEVTIPVVTKNSSPAVENKLGLLNLSHDEIIIETIPSSIPESIIIDISILENLGDSIKISDLNLDPSIKILDDDNITLASIIAAKEEPEELEESEDVSMEPELVDQKGKEETDENAE